MRRHLPKVLALVLLAGVLGGTAFFVHWYRHRFVRNDADLLALLPPEDASVFFADAEALRSSPFGQFFFSQTDEQAEYRRFARETRWNYATDLRRVVLSIGSATTYGVLQGKWNWSALQRYAVGHGGRCVQQVCSLQGSTPDRLISFAEVQPDVLAFAVGSQPRDVQVVLDNRGVRSAVSSPSAVMWMKIAPHLLQKPNSLPTPIQVFLRALQPATDVTLFVRPALHKEANTSLSLAMEVIAPDVKTAATIASRLRTQTDSLRAAIKQQGHAADTNEILRLITAGSFRSDGRSVLAAWPIDNELLTTLR